MAQLGFSPEQEDEDELQDNGSPYDSISDREPLDHSSDDEENVDTSSSVGATSPSVKDFIAARRGLPLLAAAKPGAAPDYSNDPMMQAFDQKQKDLDQYRADLAGKQSDQMKAIVLGQIAQQAARGANAPEASDVPKTLAALSASQNSQDLKGKEDDLNRRQKILDAIEQRTSRENVAASNLAMRQAILQNTQATQDARAEDKADQKTTDRFDRLNKSLTEDIANGRSAFGLAAKAKQSVENAQALLNGTLDPNDLDNRQVYELSKVLDRILSQGAATVAGTEHLTPDTARSWLAKKMEQVTNQRQGAQAGDFVNSISHTLDREKAQANKQIKDAQQKLMSTSGDLADKDPEKWNAMLHAHGLDSFDDAPPAGPQGKPGQLVNAKDPKTGQKKLYRISADGDTLEEAM